MSAGYYINTRKVWREVWSHSWRHDLFLQRMAELREVSAEWLATEANRLTGNLRACMRDAEPGNDFTVHCSWPVPVVKILASRRLMYPLDDVERVLALTGRGWGVRLLMQGIEPFSHCRDLTHIHWETWWPPADMQVIDG